MNSQFIRKSVHLVQMITIISGLGSNKHFMVIQNFVIAQIIVMVIISGSKEMNNFFVSNFTKN